MKIEPKVAWKKTHAINQTIVSALTAGSVLSHEHLLAAVGDRDNRVIFGGDTQEQLRKEDYVIFQYGVVVRDAQGRVATFLRASYEAGQQRITEARSMLLSASSPDAPQVALPRLVQQQLCVGGRAVIGAFRPLGMLWNELPVRDGKPKPTYLFALYEHTLARGVRLHGRFKESPDQGLEWIEPAQLADTLASSGYADQTLAMHYGGTTDSPGPHVIFSPRSLLTTGNASTAPILEYSSAKNVFISHASEDAFSAYALYRILLEESSRAVYPILDLVHLQDGERLTRIERDMIASCDCLVLVISPALVEKSKRKLLTGEDDWVAREVQLARAKGKPIIGFKLGTTELPHYFDKDIIANDKSFYTDWVAEVHRLIKSVQARFGPGV
jgi:hypothetical protein